MPVCEQGKCSNSALNVNLSPALPDLLFLDSFNNWAGLSFLVAGCNAPTRLVFAELKEPYSNQTIFPVGRKVEYVCRPGYTWHPGMPPAITCLKNRTWSAALEFCKSMSCEC